MQKRRMVRPDDPDADQYAYEEPRRAVSVAINTKFSVVAVGMHGYVIWTRVSTREADYAVEVRSSL